MIADDVLTWFQSNLIKGPLNLDDAGTKTDHGMSVLSPYVATALIMRGGSENSYVLLGVPTLLEIQACELNPVKAEDFVLIHHK